jgi:hypothetical protein
MSRPWSFLGRFDDERKNHTALHVVARASGEPDGVAVGATSTARRVPARFDVHACVTLKRREPSVNGRLRDTKCGEHYGPPMRKVVALCALVFWLSVGGAAWVYFSPQWTLSKMRDAAAARNATELSQYIDFPSVRESLKASVSRKLGGVASALPAGLAALAAGVTNTLADPVIDYMVTPDSLALLLSGVAPGVDGQPAAAAPTSDFKTTTSYDGWSTYVVSIKHDQMPWPVELRLHRDGLTSWKLSSITLP